LSSGRFTVLVIALGAVAITAVLVANGGADDDQPASEEAAAEPAPAGNHDELRGSNAHALTRTDNFQKAMRVLDRRRQQVEGEFESIRVAPGRIDTVIVHPDDRRTNIQIRPDMEIAFDPTHDFPTPADFRDDGLRAGMLTEVDTTALLRSIDAVRDGSAEHDVDYIVVSRDIIDGRIDQSAYMRIRTPRPRAFLKEPGEELRAIG
jgi:hypothetical protein